MKITLNIDISASELGSILAGAFAGAKQAMDKKEQQVTKPHRYKFKTVPKKATEPTPKKEQKPVSNEQPVVKRGRGRPRLTPEQKAENAAKRAAKKTASKKRVTRRWSTQEVAWLKKKIGKSKKVTKFSDSVVSDFENTFGYARTEKSLVMKAQDLLGKRDKYKGKKYGKRK
tara:strand:+ start:1361 stop:1876 length:516 start_codon:yes stop_codon:yes gene_type:complete